MRTVTRTLSLWLALIPAVAFAATAPTPTPLSYSTTFTDPSGAPQSVSFTGMASGTWLTGTLTVNGAPEQVTATIGSDGSVSGKLLNPDGSKYGVFSLDGGDNKCADFGLLFFGSWPWRLAC